jgi:hypothetical protein
MKRIRRWLFNGLAALSLLLFIATAILWVRSVAHYDVFDATGFASGYCGNLEFGSRGGQLFVRFAHWGNSIFEIRDPEHPWKLSDIGFRSGPFPFVGWQDVDQVFFAKWGLEYRSGDLGSGAYIPFQEVRIPHWLLMLFCLLPIGLWQRRRKRIRTRRANGLCPMCGYDLRATPDLCPECGTVAAKL